MTPTVLPVVALPAGSEVSGACRYQTPAGARFRVARFALRRDWRTSWNHHRFRHVDIHRISLLLHKEVVEQVVYSNITLNFISYPGEQQVASQVLIQILSLV